MKVQTERVIWEDATFDKAKNQVYTRLVYSTQAFVTRPAINLELTEHMAFLWMKPELILTNIRIVSYLKPIVLIDTILMVAISLTPKNEAKSTYD